MTDESKAIVKAAPAAVAYPIPNAQNIEKMAGYLLNSGMFPGVRNIAGAVTVIQYGSELGMGPAASLQTMSIISGRIAIESKAMLGLFRRAGGKFKIIEKSPTAASVRFWYPGDEEQALVETFTIGDAQRAGLASKQIWKQYPEEMLYWRCVSKGLRAYDPNVIMGVYSREEVQDFTNAEDAEGRVPPSSPDEPPDLPDNGQPRYEMARITLSTGKVVEVDRFKALTFFGSIKKAMKDDERYYEVLDSCGYKHANEIRTDHMAGVYAVLLDALIGKDKEQKGEQA